MLIMLAMVGVRVSVCVAKENMYIVVSIFILKTPALGLEV